MVLSADYFLGLWLKIEKKMFKGKVKVAADTGNFQLSKDIL